MSGRHGLAYVTSLTLRGFSDMHVLGAK